MTKKRKKVTRKNKKAAKLSLFVFLLAVVAYVFLFLAINTSFNLLNLDTSDSVFVNHLVPHLQDKNVWTVRY